MKNVFERYTHFFREKFWLSFLFLLLGLFNVFVARVPSNADGVKLVAVASLIHAEVTWNLKIFEEFWTEENLLKCLKGNDKKRQDGFEWGVNTLFSLCGFELIWVGWFRGKTSLGGADLLAFHNNTILIIECTIGSIRNDKIDRLLHTTKTIKETLGLKEINNEQKIIPMIFSSSEISNKTKGDANKVGIKIKDIDDIIKMFNLMKRKSPIEELITFLESEEGVPDFVNLYP